MTNNMLALEREIADLEAELGYAYKLAKCEQDGIVQDCQLLSTKVDSLLRED